MPGPRFGVRASGAERLWSHEAGEALAGFVAEILESGQDRDIFALDCMPERLRPDGFAL